MDVADLTLDELRLALAPGIADAAVFDGWSDAALEMAADQLGAELPAREHDAVRPRIVEQCLGGFRMPGFLCGQHPCAQHVAQDLCRLCRSIERDGHVIGHQPAARTHRKDMRGTEMRGSCPDRLPPAGERLRL